MKKDDLINSFSERINSKSNLSKVKILILNAPCHGFGDVIFGYKLKRYLNQWYPTIEVKIATTKVDNFLSIGEDPNSLIQLNSLSTEMQCRRFSKLIPSQPLNNFNLIFVAPLQQDYDISYSDIRQLIPYSNKLNTYFFSEYNDSTAKDMDFNTGVGKGRYGMMFTKMPSGILNDTAFLKSKELKKNNYAVCYIANTIVNMRQCYLSFFEMVSKKYKTKKVDDNNFTIVIPPSLVSDIESSQSSLRKIYKYFSTIVLVKKDGQTAFEDLDSKNNNVLYLRADVLPVKNSEMLTLMYNSVSDILLTGDQSITDALSCCPKKNIWYQIAPWKESFGKQLGINMPQKYYKHKKTSCGTIEGVSLKSDYREFVKKYDFRKLAKPKLNRIINMTLSNL